MPPKKPEINKPLLNLLVSTFTLFLVFLTLILGDISSGVLSGKPETGWGIMFAIFFFGPLLLIYSIFSLLKIKRLRSDGQNISHTVKRSIIIVTLIYLTLYVFIEITN